jgi:hypothetical protein
MDTFIDACVCACFICIFVSTTILATMNSSASIRLAFLGTLLSICSSCETIQIKLEPVRILDLPEYIATDKHFGKNLTSIQEQNEFLLVTGRIDTTSEFPPQQLAIIKINATTYSLHRTIDEIINPGTRQEFDGNGYHVTLQYKRQRTVAGHNVYEGTLAINGFGNSSVYQVTGTDGYY